MFLTINQFIIRLLPERIINENHFLKTKITDNLACPIDGLMLETKNKQWVCANNHSFDISRQGYVNLLPVQHKRSKHPGDSKEMVIARTNFLNSGVYQPLADTINTIICPLVNNHNMYNLLDAGCGEGYYFDYLFCELDKLDLEYPLSFIGLDISKEAIVQASKRNKKISWIVGTNRQPPIAEASVDIILCVFGFVSFKGFSQILKPGGKLMLVDPGAEHLKELRDIIYHEVKSTAATEIDTDLFSITNSQDCKFRTETIDSIDIDNLLKMTPHLFRASKEGKEAASKLGKLNLTVDVVIRTLTKM
jgi:23S rRNA (guanine745-N1)-methyltransferase